MVLQLIPAFLALIVVTGHYLGAASRQATKRIVAPVNALDLDHPLDNDVYEELSPLLKRMDDSASALTRRCPRSRRSATSSPPSPATWRRRWCCSTPAARYCPSTARRKSCWACPAPSARASICCAQPQISSFPRPWKPPCAAKTPNRDGDERPPLPLRGQPRQGRGARQRRGDAHSRRHRPLPRRKGAPRVYRQRLPRVENAADLHPRLCRDHAKRRRRRGQAAPVRRPHPRRGYAAHSTGGGHSETLPPR